MQEEHAGIARQFTDPHQALLLLDRCFGQPYEERIAALLALDADLAPLEAAQLLRIEAGCRLGRARGHCHQQQQ